MVIRIAFALVGGVAIMSVAGWAGWRNDGDKPARLYGSLLCGSLLSGGLIYWLVACHLLAA